MAKQKGPDIEGASLHMQGFVKKLKGHFNTKKILLIGVAKDNKTGEVYSLIGNGDEDITLDEFAISLFDIIGKLHNNLTLREVKKQVDKIKESKPDNS